jgi:hypothetical protein
MNHPRSVPQMQPRRKRSNREIVSLQRKSLSSMTMGMNLLSGMLSSYQHGVIEASAVINLCQLKLLRNRAGNVIGCSHKFKQSNLRLLTLNQESKYTV